MRIAVYDNLPPGGAKRAAYELGRRLARDHEVDLYQLSTTSRDAFDLSPDVGHVFRYRYAPLFGLLNQRLAQGHLAPRSLTMFAPLRALHVRIARDMSDRGYDIVLAHTDAMTQSPYLLRWLPPGVGVYYCQEVLRVTREPAVLAEHRRTLRRSPEPIATLRVLEDRWVLPRWQRADLESVRCASAILVNSGYSREQVMAAYGRTATVAYLGVDEELFAPQAGAARDREMLSIGSPITLKGHELTVRALSLVPAPTRPRLRVVASPSADRDALAVTARRLEVEIAFDSQLSDRDLATRYRRALATICAARMEPFGLTALESMACGTPVVAIKEGGYLETVVNGETGLLADPTPEALSAAIAKLASSPAEVDRLGQQGRAHVLGGWTWAQSAHRLEDILGGLARR
jgi:glycosyltransferase involved in cell wall biosynthesis